MTAADDPQPLPRPGRHWVSGSWIACCEDGETDCPCTCHDDTPEDQ